MGPGAAPGPPPGGPGGARGGRKSAPPGKCCKFRDKRAKFADIVSRLGELLNTLENVHFSAPRPRGGLRAGQRGPPWGPPGRGPPGPPWTPRLGPAGGPGGGPGPSSVSLAGPGSPVTRTPGTAPSSPPEPGDPAPDGRAPRRTASGPRHHPRAARTCNAIRTESRHVSHSGRTSRPSSRPTW